MDDGFVDMYKRGLPASESDDDSTRDVRTRGSKPDFDGDSASLAPPTPSQLPVPLSNHAIGQAYQMVRYGDGGSPLLPVVAKTVFSFGFLKAWEAMRVVSPDTCRPFSKDRRGLVLGEGGELFWSSRALEAAKARGATILGEIVGFGMSSDAHHITQPSAGRSGGSAMTSALEKRGHRSGIGGGYVNAHGTGTAANDVSETTAIRKGFLAHMRISWR